ncbi:hypothetical protein Syun_010103 [Stephania yunnanensis]|uniref:Uncharacterized protein n=1 Tax=Stephania yunnanensis TaxID=152371 RepID=A0AAP0PRC2_9MAGN
MEVRSTGQSINATVSMLMTFVIGQVFLSLLYAAEFSLFYMVAMTLFVDCLLPSGDKARWFWRRIVPAEDSRTDVTSNSSHYIYK